MKSELLMRIKDAEAAANGRVEEAQAEATALLQKARRDAEQLLADGKAATDQKYQSALAEARDEAQEEAKKILSGGKRQATNLRKKFETGVEGVADRALALFEESL